MAVPIQYHKDDCSSSNQYHDDRLPKFLRDVVKLGDFTYISEEEYSNIPYPVKFLEWNKNRDDLRKYYRVTSTIFGREEKDGTVTVFIDGEENEILEMKRDFMEKYFAEAL